MKTNPLKLLSLAFLGTAFAATVAFAGPSYTPYGYTPAKGAASNSKSVPACCGKQDTSHKHDHKQKGCSMHEMPNGAACKSQVKQ